MMNKIKLSIFSVLLSQTLICSANECSNLTLLTQLPLNRVFITVANDQNLYPYRYQNKTDSEILSMHVFKEGQQDLTYLYKPYEFSFFKVLKDIVTDKNSTVHLFFYDLPVKRLQNQTYKLVNKDYCTKTDSCSLEFKNLNSKSEKNELNVSLFQSFNESFNNQELTLSELKYSLGPQFKITTNCD